MGRRIIAVEFDADLGTSRDLARAIDKVARLVDADANVYTQTFRPLDWDKSEAVITIEQGQS